MATTEIRLDNAGKPQEVRLGNLAHNQPDILDTGDLSRFPGQFRLQPSEFSKPSHRQPDRRS